MLLGARPKIKMLPIPTKFFVTSGKAVSRVSDLNAFDEALLNAGIGEQNLVPVSSVLPIGIKKVARQTLPRGAITHCVLAQQRGAEGETISAGIAWGFRADGQGGYVAEGHGHMNKRALTEVLQWKMEEIAKLRNTKLTQIHFAVEELSTPMDNYGTCLGAVVFLQ
ncbi:MAG: pyruvoyl-dependent arginine decarboxylase [Methanobacteriota archaeon]